jgi:hypothetical protein
MLSSEHFLTLAGNAVNTWECIVSVSLALSAAYHFSSEDGDSMLLKNIGFYQSVDIVP